MREELTMSVRELDRMRVIHQVLEQRLTWRQAGEQLSLSVRQIGSLCARVRVEGSRGVIHRLRGRPSNHRLAPGVMEQVLRVVRARYEDFGPTLAVEKLREVEGIRLSVSALRQGMIRAGLWQGKKGRVKHRTWRPRRSCVGELVQLDGSVHAWFEDRGPACVLIAYIDDATSRVLYAEFVHSEDTRTLLGTTQRYLKRHGRPVALYVDQDSIYRINRQATVEEELREMPPLTQFTRAMTELEIAVIPASSPQAKGRVERLFGTFQDRLVKELRLQGISRMEAANRFLGETYLERHNARFAVAPASGIDAHRPLRRGQRLEEVLCIRTERTLLNDFTVRYQNAFYQVLPTPSVRVRPGAKIQVELRLDGSLHLRSRGHSLRFNVLPPRPSQSPAAASHSPQDGFRPFPKPVRPAQNHPWRKLLSRKPRPFLPSAAAAQASAQTLTIP